MTTAPTIRARVDELVLLVTGLSAEIEKARTQTSYIGEIVQDLLRRVASLKTDPQFAARMKH